MSGYGHMVKPSLHLVIIAIEFVFWHKYTKKLLFSAVSIHNVKRYYYQGARGGRLGMFMDQVDLRRGISKSNLTIRTYICI